MYQQSDQQSDQLTTMVVLRLTSVSLFFFGNASRLQGRGRGRGRGKAGGRGGKGGAPKAKVKVQAKGGGGGRGRGNGGPSRGRGRGANSRAAAGKAAVRVARIQQAPKVYNELAMAGSHTILLLQAGKTQIWQQYDTQTKAVEGLIHMFEEQLKKAQPGKTKIKYSVEDLYGYIDQMADLNALCADRATGSYKPQDKAWVKKKIYQVLKNGAQ